MFTWTRFTLYIKCVFMERKNHNCFHSFRNWLDLWFFCYICTSKFVQYFYFERNLQLLLFVDTIVFLELISLNISTDFLIRYLLCPWRVLNSDFVLFFWQPLHRVYQLSLELSFISETWDHYFLKNVHKILRKHRKYFLEIQCIFSIIWTTLNQNFKRTSSSRQFGWW